MKVEETAKSLAALRTGITVGTDTDTGKNSRYDVVHERTMFAF